MISPKNMEYKKNCSKFSHTPSFSVSFLSLSLSHSHSLSLSDCFMEAKTNPSKIFLYCNLSQNLGQIYNCKPQKNKRIVGKFCTLDKPLIQDKTNSFKMFCFSCAFNHKLKMINSNKSQK